MSGVFAEPHGELSAARVGDRGHFDQGFAELQAYARREVLMAEIKIDVELVTRQGPALPAPRHQRGNPGVHQGELHVQMFG